MTWLIAGVIGLTLGWLLGLVTYAHVSRAIEAENRELRAGLRFVRNTVGMTIGYRPLVQYIDRLLGEEAA